MKLSGETVAVVTGVASGIGRALAEDLGQRGCRLMLVDREPLSLKPDSILQPKYGHIEHCTADVSSAEAMRELAEHCQQRFGGADLVINNAGIALCQTAEATDNDAFDRVIQVNFWGMVHGARAFLPQMLERGKGSLVFLSSILGIIGAPTQSAYCASKFGIRGYAECLQQEVADRGINVLVVCPGGVRTNIIRNGRIDQWADAVPGGGKDPEADFRRMARSSPEQAAAEILKGVERDAARVLVGRDARWLDRIQRIFPASYAAKVQRLVNLTGG